jgi:hypothetical protein
MIDQLPLLKTKPNPILIFAGLFGFLFFAFLLYLTNKPVSSVKGVSLYTGNTILCNYSGLKLAIKVIA